MSRGTSAVLRASIVAALSAGGVVACARRQQSVLDEVTSYNQLTSNNWARNEHTITPDNVGTLGVKWAFEAKGAVSATPVVVDGYVYTSDWGGYLYKVDANTGAAVWSVRIDDSFAAGTGEPEDTEPYVTIDGVPWPTRLVAQARPVVAGNKVIFTLKRPLTTPGRVDPRVYDSTNTPNNPFHVANPPAAAFIAAFDKNTGALRWKQVLHDFHTDADGRRVGMTGSTATAAPVVFGNRVYAAVANETGLLRLPSSTGESAYADFFIRGKVVCLDLRNGEVIWSRHTISDELYQPTSDGTRYTGAGIWGTPVVDRIRRLLYVGTGNNTSLPTGDIAAGRFPTSDEGNHVDSVMALDLDTGDVIWSTSTQVGDRDVYQGGISAFVAARIDPAGNPIPEPDGSYKIVKQALPPQVGYKDYDLGAAINLFETPYHPFGVIGAGSKSGIYWALDPDTGSVIWSTRVGPGGILGGIHWLGASDGRRIYVSCNNSLRPWPLEGGEPGGGWTAIDAATGDIEWQTADPLGALTATGTGNVIVSQHYRPIGSSVYPTLANGNNVWVGTDSPAAIANGVLFEGTGDMEFQRDTDGNIKLVNNYPVAIPGNGGHMYALDARTGAILWSFESGASVYGGATVRDGVVYWGSGYPRFGDNPVNVKRDGLGVPILLNGQPIPTNNGVGGFGGAGYLYAFELKEPDCGDPK